MCCTTCVRVNRLSPRHIGTWECLPRASLTEYAVSVAFEVLFLPWEKHLEPSISQWHTVA